jgi:acetyl esterase/lipase
VIGSCYFYIEFLMAWLSLLRDAGYQNPAVFAVEYSLAPEAQFPTQAREVYLGYLYLVRTLKGDTSRICISGDSAGGALILSLMVCLSSKHDRLSSLLHHIPTGLGRDQLKGALEEQLRPPALVLLISPWVNLISDDHYPTASDYISPRRLHEFARLYAPDWKESAMSVTSPGAAKGLARLTKKRYAPTHGYFIWFGKEEVLAQDIATLIPSLEEAGIPVDYRESPGEIHAWPVASLFLSSTENTRLKGLRLLVDRIQNSVSVQ